MGEILFPVWDPVMLHLFGLQIRWYGVMFVVGFFAAQFILGRLARSGFFPLPVERTADLIFWMLFGVVLGGRLGYCAFYQPAYLLEPGKLIAVWEGGLSFHGGVIGVVIVFVLFARRHRVSAWRLADCMAISGTPGIFAVRCANFINGELYGRITDDSVPWAMRFPADPKAQSLLGISPSLGMRAREEKVLEAVASGKWSEIRDQVPLRHPSQIYEALGEGLILGLVLYVLLLATRKYPLGRGVYGGVFLLGYGVVRFVIEYFREPDAHLGLMGGFSRGQQLCSAMILIGALIIWFNRGRRDPLPATEEASG